MKLLAFLMFAVLAVSAADSYSQAAKFSLKLKDATVREVFDHIEDNSEFILLYNEKWVDVNRRVDIDVKNETVEKVLDQMLKGTSNVYKIYDRQVVILEDKKAEIPANIQRQIVEAQTQQPQQKEITGTVTDTDGLPLPGVSIIVKGTTIGTVTNADGEFSLNIPLDAEILQFSFIGMQTQEVPIEDKNTFTVVMEEDVVGIEEVVAVGYGTIRKSDLTGAVAKVTSEELEKSTGASFDQQMAGKLAGVQVTQQSGAPGAGSVISIRGFNSFSGAQPLYVVDGYPIDMDNAGNAGGSMWDSDVQQMNPLAMLNPNDIESIEVLKDASSTAIYGSRGANGVIMITTKTGKKGINTVNYNYRFEMSEIGKTYDMLDTRDYMEYANEAYANEGQDPLYDPLKMDSLVAVNPNTNWQDVIYRTAQTHNHGLTFTGADDVSRYNITMNYLDQEGIIINSDFQRFSFRVNASRKINKNIDVGTTSNFTYTTSTAAAHSFSNGHPGGSVVIGGIFFRPFDKPFSEDQESDEIVNSNPVIVANKRLDDSQIQNVYSSIYANLKLTDGLVLRFNGGLNSVVAVRDQYQPRDTYFGDLTNGFASRSIARRMNFLNEVTLNYNKTLGKIHRINAVLGTTYQKWFSYHLLAYGNDFVNDNLGYERLSAAGVTSPSNTSHIEWDLQSFLGRINYSLLDRYLLTLTGRADGASRLGIDNKWDFFPALALGWNVHNEAFMEPVSVISRLKIRGSYGITGSQTGIPVNSLVAALYPYQYAVNGMGVTGFNQQSNYWGGGTLANQSLVWETTTQMDIGADIGVLNNRFTLGFDYFKKTTDKLLQQLGLPYSTGYGAYATNAGSVENKGWEFELSARIIQGAFNWNVTGNISSVKNKLIDLGSLEEIYGRTYLSAGNISANKPLHIARLGHPIGMFYGLNVLGVFQNQEEIDAYVNYEGTVIQPTAKPGDWIYEDLLTVDTDGDGKADAGDGMINTFDRALIGNPYPDFTFGITNSFTYKNFSLDASINGSIGNDIVNLNLYALDDPNFSSNWNISKKAYENAWRGEGTTNYYQRVRNSGTISNGEMTSRLIEDGSYVRLNNVVLSYDFNVKGINAVKEARIFVGGRNLVTITNYSGYDPEVSGMGTNAMNRAVDWGTYPMSKTYYAGLNIKF